MPKRGRAPAIVIGGLVVALLAAAGIVVALARRRIHAGEADAPRFVEEAQAAGIDHVYDGEFEHFVGGGVAAFDCDDDGRPELYFAGGSEPAALYRNESPIGGATRFAPLPSPVTDLTAVTGAYPLDIDSDSTSISSSCAAAATSCSAGWATADSKRPTSSSASTAATPGRLRSAPHGRGRTRCPRWRSGTTSCRARRSATTASSCGPTRR